MEDLLLLQYDKDNNVWFRVRALEYGGIMWPYFSISDSPNLNVATVYDSSPKYESYNDAVKGFKEIIIKFAAEKKNA